MKLIRLLKKDLAKESALWVENDFISANQARNICAFYGADYDNPTSHSTGYFVLVTLGYLFVGLAAITLIGANWENLPRGLRMAALILVTFGIHLAALYNFQRQKENAAIGLFFLGSLFYGASIMLIAQIYHIGEHYPDGIFWWAAGVLPLAWLLKSRLLMLLTMALAFTWFFTEAHLDYFPWFFPVFLIALGLQVFRVYQSSVLFLLLAAGSGLFFEYCLSWWLGGFRGFDMEIENLFTGFALFVLFHGLAKWLYQHKNPALKDYGTILGLYVLRFFILSLFIFSFKEPWRELLRADFQAPELMIGITILLCLVSLWLSFLADRQAMVSLLVSLLVGTSLITAVFFDINPKSLYPVVATNLVLIGTGTWLIIEGIRSATSHFFFLGVLTILATGLCRYIDLVGDYIGAAILFAVFAVILLTTAGFWRRYHNKKGNGHV